MSQQIGTRAVKITAILSRRSVVDGFNSVRNGKPFDYEAVDADGIYAWGYERGRLLALVYDGPLKEGRYVTQGAINAWFEARREGVIL